MKMALSADIEGIAGITEWDLAGLAKPDQAKFHLHAWAAALEAMRMLRFDCQARRETAHACAVRGGAAGAPARLPSAGSASHGPPCGDRTP
jgi:hypothetical protein